MKALFNCHVPFMLAHGGAQTQVERSKAALEEIGIETGNFEWWNTEQTGDILHHFGHLTLPVIKQAQRKGMKVAITILLSETCNRSKGSLLLRQVCIRGALGAPVPDRLKAKLPWQAYQEADAMIVGLEAEREVLENAYGVDGAKISVVPIGLTETFLKADPGSRSEDHLICQGTIGPTKKSLELAQMARAAQVPILFVGKPPDEASDYWRRFRELVDNRFVKRHEHVASEGEMVALLRAARGFVLKSRFENWCLAAHEAAACGLPLLLPDLRWARERFGNSVSYFPKTAGGGDAKALRAFYDQSLKLPPPQARLFSWREVAERLREVYARLLPASSAPATFRSTSQ